MKRSRIRTDPEKVRAWQERSRKALPRESRKRREAVKSHRAIREAVFARDRYLCRMPIAVGGPCVGPLTPHHVRKASQGGGYTVENLIALCRFHNDWCEDEPDIAHRLGFVKRAGE